MRSTLSGLQEFLRPADTHGGNPLHRCLAGLLVEAAMERAFAQAGAGGEDGQVEMLAADSRSAAVAASGSST